MSSPIPLLASNFDDASVYIVGLQVVAEFVDHAEVVLERQNVRIPVLCFDIFGNFDEMIAVLFGLCHQLEQLVRAAPRIHILYHARQFR